MKCAPIVLTALLLAACATSEAVPLSNNEVLIKTSADPDCGSAKAAAIAAQTAAITTLRSGYDSYIVVRTQSSDTVQYIPQPGTFTTTKTVKKNGSGGKSVSTETTYTPNPPTAVGNYGQDIQIRMFHTGEPGSANAIPARTALGPNWKSLVANGAPQVCL